MNLILLLWYKNQIFSNICVSDCLPLHLRLQYVCNSPKDPTKMHALIQQVWDTVIVINSIMIVMGLRLHIQEMCNTVFKWVFNYMFFLFIFYLYDSYFQN